MPTRQQIRVHPVATQKDGRDARSPAPPAMANMRNAASARTCRAYRAVMSPMEFTALVAGWGAGLVLLLFISTVVRHLI